MKYFSLLSMSTPPAENYGVPYQSHLSRDPSLTQQNAQHGQNAGGVSRQTMGPWSVDREHGWAARRDADAGTRLCVLLGPALARTALEIAHQVIGSFELKLPYRMARENRTKLAMNCRPRCAMGP
jgi:hypothetical protein